MEVIRNNYMPGDTRLVEQLVSELKSQGIFDHFRKECISDVDTKPAYQNLRQRVEGTVATFLSRQTWSIDLNKNQLREQLRKNLHESGFLETGVERIVDQVVNPKISTVFLPKVEDVVYRFLGIEKPAARNVKIEEKKVCVTDLLPTDLEAVSPESVGSLKNDNKNDSLQSSDKMEEDESPAFEPLVTENSFNFEDAKIVDDNSGDSRLSGFSGLQSHESHHGVDNKIEQIELSNQDSSETRLSIITSEETTKMELCEESIKAEIKPDESDAANVVLKEDKKEPTVKPEESKKYEDKKPKSKDRKDDKYKKSSSSSHKSSKHSSHRDKKDSKSRENDKSKDRSHKDKEKSSKHKSDSDKKPEKSKSDKDIDKKSNSDKKSKSDKDIDKNKSSREKSNRDKDKERHKHKDKDNKDNKENKDKDRSTKSDKKSSSSSKHSSSSDKRKEPSKKSYSDSKSDKNKKDSKKKSKDDHYSSKNKKTDRRSTDRDSNDGTSSKNNFISTYSESTSSKSENNSQDYSNSSISGGSGDSGNSDQTELVNKDVSESSSDNGSLKLNLFVPVQPVKYMKPKFASNFEEARKIMKIRKQLAKMERQNQLGLTRIEVPIENGIVEKNVHCTEIIVHNNEEIELIETDLPENEIVIGNEENVNDVKDNEIILVEDSINIELNDDVIKLESEDTKEAVFKCKELSLENFEALEAKLAQVMSKVNYNSYESDEDYEFHGYNPTDIPDIPKQVIELSKAKLNEIELLKHQLDQKMPCENHKINNPNKLSIIEYCLYLEKPNLMEENKLKHIHGVISKLEKEIEECIETSKNNYWPVKRGRKRKLVESVDMKNNNIDFMQTEKKRRESATSNTVTSKANKKRVCNNTDISPHEQFSLPLSPAESDKSNDRKEEDLLIPIKQKRIIRGYSQRYSSDDLYKPRPVIGRRNRFPKNAD